MPSADFCPAVRMPRGILSRRSDTEQISWGKFSHLPCAVAGSTLRILDGYGLRGKWPARPTLAPCTRFLSIDSHVCSTLPSDLASRRYPALKLNCTADCIDGAGELDQHAVTGRLDDTASMGSNSGVNEGLSDSL